MTCPSCHEPVRLRPEESACPRCGAKVRETLEEMNVRVAVEQTAHTIKRARMWLLIAAIFVLANGLLGVAAVGSSLARVPPVGLVILGSPIVLGLVFLGLWWYATRNAVVATGAALVLFAAAVVVEVVAVPSSIFYPIPTLFRALVLVSLVTGVRAAVRHRRLSADAAERNRPLP